MLNREVNNFEEAKTLSLFDFAEGSELENNVKSFRKSLRFVNKRLRTKDEGFADTITKFNLGTLITYRFKDEKEYNHIISTSRLVYRANIKYLLFNTEENLISGHIVDAIGKIKGSLDKIKIVVPIMTEEQRKNYFVNVNIKNIINNVEKVDGNIQIKKKKLVR